MISLVEYDERVAFLATKEHGAVSGGMCGLVRLYVVSLVYICG